jgi:anti-sigma regulatory factor (Ser/Thr protein kinase)
MATKNAGYLHVPEGRREHATPPKPSTSTARRFLAGILDGCQAADDAVLCLSELVTNATIHSRSCQPGGHFRVRAERHGRHVRVEVADQGGPWAQSQPHDDQNGRGLLVVAQLAREFGRSGDEHAGWTVWYEIEAE